MSEDFPEPLTPVTTVSASSGMSTLTFWRLFSVAPFNFIYLVGFLLSAGICIVFSPRKNLAVSVLDLRSFS